MSIAVEAEIRPFHIDVSDDELADLRRRIAAVRLPHKELVADRSQGVQLATIEAILNALPQAKTEIDGVDIHCQAAP